MNCGVCETWLHRIVDSPSCIDQCKFEFQFTERLLICYFLTSRKNIVEAGTSPSHNTDWDPTRDSKVNSSIQFCEIAFAKIFLSVPVWVTYTPLPLASPLFLQRWHPSLPRRSDRIFSENIKLFPAHRSQACLRLIYNVPYLLHHAAYLRLSPSPTTVSACSLAETTVTTDLSVIYYMASLIHSLPIYPRPRRTFFTLSLRTENL